MSVKSALEIIKDSLAPEDAAKFHSGSRKPFDYEQPVIDAAKEAMCGRTFKAPSTVALDDVDYFFPDRQLVIYYKKVLAGLEERIISVKQKIEAAEKRLGEQMKHFGRSDK